jgi:hypothetical protein
MEREVQYQACSRFIQPPGTCNGGLSREQAVQKKRRSGERRENNNVIIAHRHKYITGFLFLCVFDKELVEKEIYLKSELYLFMVSTS